MEFLIASIVSLLLLLAGLMGIASGLMYQTLLSGSLDFAYYSPFVAAFAVGILVFVWAHRRWQVPS